MLWNHTLQQRWVEHQVCKASCKLQQFDVFEIKEAGKAPNPKIPVSNPKPNLLSRPSSGERICTLHLCAGVLWGTNPRELHLGRPFARASEALCLSSLVLNLSSSLIVGAGSQEGATMVRVSASLGCPCMCSGLDSPVL